MIPSVQTAYINARLVDPASELDAMGSLITFGEEIQAIGPNLFPDGVPNNFRSIDCGGHVICPGLIDMRVFVGEPGAEHKETLASASQAAAAGGVTTIVVMPNTDPVIDDASLVDFIKRRARDTAIVNVHPMAALTKGLEGKALTEIGLLQEAGAVAFTDGNKSIANAGMMRQGLTYARAFDALICHHTEDADLSRGGAMNEGEFADRLGLRGIPTTAESIMVDRDIALVKLTGSRYHASQISCAAALSSIEQAKRQGLNVTCGVSAHHLALNELDIAEYRSFMKTNPPLRAEEDRKSMVEGLARGVIDVIVSSHEPQAPENKRLPFEDSSDGCVGLETMLPVALERYHNREIGLLPLLRTMTQNPAEILKLPVGKLAPGAPADFVVFDPDYSYSFDAKNLKSRSKNTPFDGRRMQGQVMRTVVRGRTVFESDRETSKAA